MSHNLARAESSSASMLPDVSRQMTRSIGRRSHAVVATGSQGDATGSRDAAPARAMVLAVRIPEATTKVVHDRTEKNLLTDMAVLRSIT
jgi:hypothetical protein